MEYKQTLIKIEDLSYSVDGKLILKNVNAEIKDIKGRGQVVALLGPSGVGKSTLFNLMSGFLQPSSGKILAHLKEDGMQEVHSHIMGVVKQDYPLFEHRTVCSNLCLVGDKDKASKLLADFGMLEHGDKYPIQLSGGQRQKVAIIQQILCSEKYILMDEPFSGLDLIAKCDVCRLINKVVSADEENTINIVTHGVEDAIEVADTIWMLGRDRDPQGNAIPGAYIKQTINLLERGFSGTCCAVNDPKYYQLIKEIQADFLQL